MAHLIRPSWSVPEGSLEVGRLLARATLATVSASSCALPCAGAHCPAFMLWPLQTGVLTTGAWGGCSELPRRLELQLK